MQTFSFSLLDFTSTVHTFFFIFRYCLWLLECSHMTGRQYAIMFFGLAVPYLNVLQIFDHQVCFIKVCNFFSLKNFFAPIMKGEGGCNVSSHDITAIFWVLLLQQNVLCRQFLFFIFLAKLGNLEPINPTFESLVSKIDKH